ncbi:hypothetical protein PHYPO_G00001530 [Pangasianodon hypophthalmus]|uniref:VWFA domain-containing protein n=1 Tax=Pangasianodon hypophthalmus TaxID=310915 RepID=A0A5N5Q3F4_PANHP|nr:hypothetical protein PHYPO_G00001530 [Pangasianodon hypophthalmus]
MGKLKGLLPLFILASSFLVSSAQKTVCKQEALADIVFLVDGSQSIGTENFQKIRDFLFTLVNSFDVSPDKVRIGLVQYSDSPHTEFYLNSFETKQKILGYITTLSYQAGGTKTGLGLSFLLKQHFVKEAGSRAEEGVPQIAVVITDGKSQDNVEPHAQDLKRQGIILYAIGIKDADMEQLKEIATKPHEQHIYNVSDFTALQGISQSFIQLLCTTVEEATRQVSQVPQGCKADLADIVFLVDSSGSIGDADFLKVKQFLHTFIMGLDIRPDKVRVGVAQFSNEPRQEFLLGEYADKNDLLEKVDKLTYLRGGTETGKALDFILNNYFTESGGSRINESVPQIAVVITDGESTDDMEIPAMKLRRKGVLIFTIGVGAASITDLQSIANKPHQRFVLSFTDYEELLKATTSTVDKVCISVAAQQEECKSVADIVFIVDVSDRTTTPDLVRGFLCRMISGLHIESNSVRVGIVLYSETPTAEFYLNTFNSKSEILQYIKRLPFGGGESKISRALKFAREKVFAKEMGSRRAIGVQQIAVVITEEKSLDSVTAAEAAKLIRSGVQVYALGLSIDNEEQLKQIASYPPAKFVFSLQSFSNLGCVQTEQADIYFLIDSSSSTENNIQEVKAFIREFLLMFTIGPTQVRVGVVKFAEEPTLEFSLTTYNDRMSLERAVNNIKHDGGDTFIGKALSTMTQYFEEAEKTRGTKVRNILIVITDGESWDMVSKPAAQLRAQGVSTYAIGVKDANKTELLLIAGEPERMFFVSNFHALTHLKDEIVTHICLEEACKNMWADVIFLIDGSGNTGPEDFSKIKEFMNTTVSKFKIDKNSVQVGVVQFSSYSNTEFALNKFSDKSQMQQAINEMQQQEQPIKNMKQLGEGTKTGAALNFVSEYFDPPEGGRSNAPQFLIMITNGRSMDDVAQPAQALRNKSITIYSIGLSDSNSTQLREISGTQDIVFLDRDDDILNFLDKVLLLKICKSADKCQKSQVADVVFLVDGSTSIESNNFERMKFFMNSVVNKTQVGQHNVRICTIVYSNTAKVHFRLNQHYSKEEVHKAISDLEYPTGDTYTAQALRYSLDYFDEAKGGRGANGVPQMLFVITDGEATDQYYLKEAADKLHKYGISIYGIGVANASKDELETITKDENKVFHVNNFQALIDLWPDISNEICKKTKPGKYITSTYQQ